MDRTGVIAIDGPAGAGKSTVARKVAERLGIRYLDTGALYRAMALYLDEQGISALENEELKKALFYVNVEIGDKATVLVNGRDVSSEIRTPRIDRLASLYSALPSVRQRLLALQRAQALNGALVADGRDMGTVVFTQAPVKIFLTASADVRARRRCDELLARGVSADFSKILEEIKNRDAADSSRAVAPLRQAEDAVLVDSSDMTIEQVTDAIVRLVCSKTQNADKIFKGCKEVCHA